jgi:hypothetical protein
MMDKLPPPLTYPTPTDLSVLIWEIEISHFYDVLKLIKMGNKVDKHIFKQKIRLVNSKE